MAQLYSNSKDQKKAVLFTVQTKETSDSENDSSLQELTRLVTTMGLKVVGTVSQKRHYPSVSTILGEGKLKELARFTGGSGVVETYGKKNEVDDESDFDDDLDLDTDDHLDLEQSGQIATEETASIVIYDGELSPRQLKNLEQATSAEVLDRTGVILEIFSRHAKSPEAMIQVEIAKLVYLGPRLRMSRSGSDRQGGGIGSKGAGETSHELDKRRIRDRITELKAKLVSIHAEQSRRRSRRKENCQIALVGYTNAGKSSLMRALTGSEVLVADKLFATLDTRVRALFPVTFPNVLVSDTVGFIKKLPHDLVASFQSTLDEALAASVLLFTVDASDPDFRSQLTVTQDVLSEIGAGDIPRKLVLNKIDKLSAAELQVLRAEYPEAIFISAHSPESVAELRTTILDMFSGDMVESTITFPFDKGQLLGQLRSKASIIAESYDEHGTTVKIKTFPSVIEWAQKNLAEGKGQGQN
ncbi:GTPase HflX [Oligoflexaceae bacterium]|nr:GTPase HflX [Oligoflexaceae bacterium]